MDADACVRTLVGAFTDAIESVMRGDTPPSFSMVGYPNPYGDDKDDTDKGTGSGAT
jgi:hypothetical protein